jgi:hypothetical protein
MDGPAPALRSPAWPWALLALAVLAALCLRLAVGGFTVQTAFPWSAAILLDGASRIVDGQAPYRDFHTPVGFTYLGALAAFLRLAHGSPHALAWFSASAGLLIGLLAWALAARRCAPPLAAAAAVAIGLLAASPAFFAYGALDISYGGHYSRLSWALFFVIAIAATLPARAPRRWPDLLEAVGVGACLGLVAGTKFTFLFAGGALVGLDWWYRRPGWREPVAMAGGLVAAFALGLAVSGATLAGYLHDCRMVGANASLLPLLLASRHNLDLLGLALVGVVAALSWPALRAGWRPGALQPLPRIPLLALAVLVLGLGLSATNGNEAVSPVYALVMLILAAGAAQAQEGAGAAAPPAVRAPLLISGAVLLALSARLATPMVIGPYAAVKAPQSSLAGGPWRGIEFVPPSGETQPTRAALWTYLSREPKGMLCNAWYLWVRDGEALLRPRVGAQERVLCMDFLNPFPYLLERPAPRGDHLYWHFGRNVGEATAPKAVELFADADWVMVPKVPIFKDSTARKCALYLPWITAHYQQVGVESEWWACYHRVPPAP